jgi:hypothetical protein
LHDCRNPALSNTLMVVAAATLWNSVFSKSSASVGPNSSGLPQVNIADPDQRS